MISVALVLATCLGVEEGEGEEEEEEGTVGVEEEHQTVQLTAGNKQSIQ